MTARHGQLWGALYGPSSFAAKRTPVWQEIMDMIEDCVLPEQLCKVMFDLSARRSDIPEAWDESIHEIIEKKRQEIEEDDIAAIMRGNFDF